MPTKTKRDEEKWEKAKGIAEAAGQKDNYAYVMGIYKKMKPDYEFKTKGGKPIQAKTDSAQEMAIRFLLAEDLLEHQGQAKITASEEWTMGPRMAAISDMFFTTSDLMKTAQTKLDALLSDMDIPQMRRDTSKATNIRWLLRNLAINNKGHANFGKALDLLKRAPKGGKTAKSNAKVVEVPNTFHAVKVEPPRKVRKEFPFQGYIDFQGLKIDVENVKGSTRSGTDLDGDWSIFMHAHYGEIRGTEGTDGDMLDVYVGDNHDSSLVVVIHQHNPWDGKYDEDKVIIGCESIEESIGLYKKQYDRPGFFKENEYTAMPIGAFWRWVTDKKNKGKKVTANDYQKVLDRAGIEAPPGGRILELKWSAGTNDYYTRTREGWFWRRGGSPRAKWVSAPQGPMVLAAQKGKRASMNTAPVLLGNLLALLRALQWNHLTSHWQVKGDYSDHLLFERMYEKLGGEIDALAEKMVAAYGEGSVDARAQASRMSFIISLWDIGEPFKRALVAEQGLQASLADLVEIVKPLSLGMDDFLRTLANDHETHIYLLRQRKRDVTAARVANHTERNIDRERQARFLLRLGAMVGTDSTAIYALAPEQLSNIIQGGRWAEEWDKSPGDPTADKLVRQHGGAVFLTGGDGLWDVKIPTEEGYLPIVKEQGLQEPYGTGGFDDAITKLASEVIEGSWNSSLVGEGDECSCEDEDQLTRLASEVLTAGWWHLQAPCGLRRS